MNRIIQELTHLNLLKRYNRGLWARRFRLPVSLQGVKLCLHRIESSVIVSSILRGSYESDEASSLSGWLKKEDQILELGTGFGFVTTLAAKKAMLGHVLSFEANPHMVELANETLQLNRVNNVEVRQGIIGQEAGTHSFFLSPNFWESSLTPNSDWKEVVVPSFALETVLSEYEPTAVIMDIEGGEFELLQSTAWNRALSIQKMSIEFHKLPNAILSLEKLAVFGDQWESNISVEGLANQLARGHVTVTFRRKLEQS